VTLTELEIMKLCQALSYNYTLAFFVNIWPHKMIVFQGAIAQKKAIGHADRAVIIPGYSLVSIRNCTMKFTCRTQTAARDY